MRNQVGGVLIVVVVVGGVGWVADGSTPGVGPSTLEVSAATGDIPSTLEVVAASVVSAPAESTSTASSAVASAVVTDPVTDEAAAEEDEGAVAAVTVAARAARLDALVDPDDPAAAAALDGLYTAGGAAREEIDARIAALGDEGYRMRPNPEVADSLVVEDVVLVDGPPATRAEVTACVVDSVVTYQPATADSTPQASEVVVSDDVRAFRTVYMLVNEAGTWKVDTAAFVEDWPGETTCPPPPSTTTAPPTTLDPIAAEEAAVTARVLEIQAVRVNAYVNLDAPGNAEALDDAYTEGGVAREVVESDLQALRDEGWRVRENPSVPMTITVESIELRDGPPTNHANAIVCLIDSAIVYEPGGAPDGSDAVVNNDVIAGRSVQRLVREDGTWQLDEVESLDEWPGAPECPPA